LANLGNDPSGTRRAVAVSVTPCFLPPALTQAAWQLSEDLKSDWWQANAHRFGSAETK